MSRADRVLCELNNAAKRKWSHVQRDDVGTTTQFGPLDLELHYSPNSTQVSELRTPSTAHKQVNDLMAAPITQHPELRGAFHGIWVLADQGQSSLFALELPMSQIVTGAAVTGPAAQPAPIR